MVYKLRTLRDADALPHTFPPRVWEEILHSTAILESEYGEQPETSAIGGYNMVAETREDLETVRAAINLDTHPPEWVCRLDSYVSALYVMNDDFAILLFLPVAIAPDTILNEMEEDLK